MEVVLEIVLQAVGWLLQIIGELLFQIGLQLLGNGAAHAMETIVRRKEPLRPVVAAIMYAVFGGIVGALSLAVVPTLFTRPESLRLLNLLFTPVIVGVAMAAFGAWRRRSGKSVIRLESFAYGYCFALSLTVVRNIFGD